MRKEVADFLAYCHSERRLSEMTCKAYERDVRACLAFLSERGIRDLGLVRPPDLRAFLAAEAERRPALESQARAVAALKCFFRFCVENEYLDRDPALVLRTPKKSEALLDVLDRRELVRLLAATEPKDVWQRHFPGRSERDRLALALLAYACLRRGELLGLDCDDVDLERRLMRVRKAKGGRQRTVPIHTALVPVFIEYLATCAASSEPALFLAVQGRRLNYTQLGQLFRRYAAASGVNARKRVTPHTLRHVFASEFLRAGGEKVCVPRRWPFEEVKVRTIAKPQIRALLQLHSSGSPVCQRTEARMRSPA
jgi:site-specific recombinase XerD